MAQKTKSAPPARPEAESTLDKIIRLLTRFERFAWDAGGVVALAFALMTLLALGLPELARGVVLQWWAVSLWIYFGWGSAWLVVAIGVLGIWMLRKRHQQEGPGIRWSRVMAFEVAAFASLALLAVIGGTSLERAELGYDGGRVGWGLAELLRIVLAPVGLSGALWRGLLLSLVLLISLLFGFGLVGPLADWARRYAQPVERAGPVMGPGVAVGDAPLDEEAPVQTGRQRKKPVIPAEFRKNFQTKAREEEKSVEPLPRDKRLPSLSLLVNEKMARPDQRHINQTAGLIEKTLAEFGIPAKVVDFQVGPTVTQFAVVPGFLEKGDEDLQKVRVSQITSLSRDLALALAAQRLRIQAPVPGRPYVGIEVPNARSSLVRLRPVLESEAFNKVNSPLAIALGRDVSGYPVVADLSRMPHLLIAGTTGSGKSVCIAALIVCLVMNNAPEDLRLVVVDPKMVELVRFNGLPHLLGRVETDIERILGVLRWTVAEMDRRYKLLETSHSRNIDSYNNKERRKKNGRPLPRLVVLIDELADLMMSAPDQTEHNLVRLAQMARATGIHLVVATQRPSTDVVTGLIKANFPARISFAVASSIDSRVILDTGGAEALLGKGDMLFLPPEAASPIRSQGVMVSDQEVDKVLAAWQNIAPQVEDMDEAPPWEEILEEEEMLSDRDDLVIKAARIVQETGSASASMLQRRLRIGYPRAARLVDELEDLGVVGPSQGPGREREVLIGPDDEIMGTIRENGEKDPDR